VTRKTRLSALATAFGLTLTLGLALPIMATTSFTHYECTFSVDASLTDKSYPRGSIVETDPQCSDSNPNVGIKLRYITKADPSYWSYQPVEAWGWGHNQIYSWTLIPSYASNASGKALTGIYPYSWSVWQSWVD